MKQFGTITLCLALAATLWNVSAATSPLSPEQERATFQLADSNLIVELVAAEPDVRAPVAIAWDADGRMFVAEMTDYPSGPVNGRIRLLEDRDGDGRYEHAVIFATNLAYPNGVMAWKNGVLVTAAPDIWFLADTNADGVADVREKILTGFSEGNQQLRVNGLYWGIDNWIYGCNGRSDGEVKWADGTPAGSIRRRDFRFRPDTKQFEVIAGNSQFGMGHDDWGNRFPVFNNTPIRHVVMEDRYLERQPLLAGTDVVPSISPTNDGNRVFSLTPPTLLIPQPVGFFTSACGPSIFRGTALPEEYRGNYFVCEPVQNVVQRRILKPNGSTFIAEYADGAPVSDPAFGNGTKRAGSETGAPREFLASTDRWFHGVFTATGPDGAFYIVDFYRDLVEHPHWVAPEMRDKVDWRKGEEHGRIWRVRAKNAKLAKVERLSRASNNDLVDALKSDNGWTRDTAHRLLIERDALDAVRSLESLTNGFASVATRIHAANILSGLNALRPYHLVTKYLYDEQNPRAREAGVRLAGRFLNPAGDKADARYDTNLTKRWERTTPTSLTNAVRVLNSDSDARVRLQVACTLSEVPDTRTSFSGLGWVANHKELDRWQSLVLYSAAGEHPFKLLSSLFGKMEFGTDEQRWLVEKLCRAAIAQRIETNTFVIARWLAQSTSVHRFGPAAAFVEAFSPDERTSAVERIGGVRLLSHAEQTGTNSLASLSARLASVRLLDAARATGAVEALSFLLQRNEPEPLQVAVAKTLIEWDAPGPFSRRALEQWPAVSKAARRQMIVSSMKNSNGPLALLDFVEPGLIAKSEIDPATRQALQKHRDQTVMLRAKIIFADKLSADREAVVTKYRPALKLDGDRKHGAELFERTCTVCHQMQGVGAKVGPDLSGVGQHARETLLVEILDPSRQVLPDFISYAATKKDGDTVTGFIASESATTVTLRRANEPDATFVRTELKDFRTDSKSLMPDGLEAGMSEQDMADLIEFLRRPDRTLFTQPK